MESRNPKLTEAERAMLEHFLDAARAKVVRAGERVAPADAGLSGVTGSDLAVYLDLYRAACEASRRRAARVRSLDDHSARGSFGQGPTSLRWIYLHMIEETAQHCGHIDLLADAAAAARD